MKNIFNKLFIILIINSLLFLFTSQISAKRIVKPNVSNDVFINYNNLPGKIGKVKKIIDEYLIVSTKSYGDKYIITEKYNNIIEKQLILLVKESYIGNEKIYEELFKSEDYYNRNNLHGLGKIISSIPKGYKQTSISSILYNKNIITSSLLDSSFGINYSNSTNYNSLINTIKRQIENFKRNLGYYPSIKELGEISVYRNRENIKISEIISSFEYSIKIGNNLSEIRKKDKINKIKDKIKFSNLNPIILKVVNEDILKIENGLNIILAKKLIKKYELYYKKNYTNIFNEMKESISEIYFGNNSFEIKYKNMTFSLKEAKKQLEKVGVNEIVYKDYKKLIGNKEIENIPEVYKKIPNDSIFFHVSNPSFLFNLLENKQSYDSYGVEILKKVRDLIVEKAGLESFDDIKKAIKYSFIIVLSDIDLVSPNILIILDKKDKGFLGVVTPGSKPKATITSGEYILIANSKKLLDKYQDLDEEDSIYNSDDFRYVWMKKQNVAKDIFFFAGDKFFEKLISLENYIKMRRKINDYFNLSELQSFVFAYEKITGNKINDFTGLNEILQIDLKNLSDYTVKKSIVKSNKIGKINDIKNIDEINYDLDKITREELEPYKINILNYREIWRGSLDPLGIIFTGTDKGFETDFFMTPIPKLKNNKLDTFRLLFENIGTNKLDFVENKNLRIGTIGGILGFDIEKIKEKIATFYDKKNENRNLYSFFSRGIKEFNNEFLGGKNIFDYLNGEIMLSLAGLERSIFSSYNTEKIDAFLAIEFKSNLKAKEFIKIVSKAIGKKFSRGGNSFENKLKSSLIKPLSENYNSELIYIIPEVNLYFIRPSFYYTIIDKYFYISLSKNSIKKTIDFYKEPGDIKQKFIDNSLSGKKTLFMFLDSDNLKKNLDKVTQEDGLTDLYLEIKTGNNLGEINLLKHKIGVYYYNVEYNSLFGKEIRPLNEKYGILELKSKDNDVFLSINKERINIKDSELKKEILSGFDKLDEKYFTKNGGNISPLLMDKSFDEIFAIATFNMFLNKEYRDSFFNNMTSYIDMSDNEIQIKFNSFSSNIDKKNLASKTIDKTIDSIKENLGIKNDESNKNEKSNNLLYIIIGILTFIIGGGLALIFKKK